MVCFQTGTQLFKKRLTLLRYRPRECCGVAHVNVAEHERVPGAGVSDDLLKRHRGLPEVAVHLRVTAVVMVI